MRHVTETALPGRSECFLLRIDKLHANENIHCSFCSLQRAFQPPTFTDNFYKLFIEAIGSLWYFAKLLFLANTEVDQSFLEEIQKKKKMYCILYTAAAIRNASAACSDVRAFMTPVIIASQSAKPQCHHREKQPSTSSRTTSCFYGKVK